MMLQRYDIPPPDAGVSSVSATFAVLVFMVTAWATLAKDGFWHDRTEGKPGMRWLLVLGPPALTWWLLS
ncbi:hypothetical protein IMW82_12455 [Rhodanobacter sp. B2A1Ga4]|uniref:hypothetical protein n=1 Tax=Rhodanobacter sp. B2A1Ga4 TaxID=2778647 RepID=UPI001B39AA2C|nr:hypothetical protein [Rhodanobacter sp. B2A1Ga4]MBQ4855480.1 hypothetical protein [Rhodanobacter sp. B2A1Ga4]